MSGRFIHSTTPSKRQLCNKLMFPRHISTSLRPLSTNISSTGIKPNVSLEFDDRVAILTLNNPLRRNALTTRMMVQLDQHVQTLSNNNIQSKTDTNTRVVILTGIQGTFCSGLDLTDNEETEEEEEEDSLSSSLKEGRNMIKHMTRVTNQLLSLPILSISAVDGYAVGGGAELTTATDLVILSRDAKIEFVHCKRGASFGWGGGRRLVKKVGRRRALKLLLLGECIYGEEEAKSCEYADAVGDERETSLDATMRYIKPILELPCSQSIRAIKSTISSADDEAIVIAMKREQDSFLSVWGGEANMKQIQKTKDRLRDKEDDK